MEAPTSEPTLKEELTGQEHREAPVDKFHQFDSSQLKYDRNHKMMFLWAVIILAGIAAVAGFLLLTEQGRNLVGLGVNTNTSSSTSSTQPPLEEVEEDTVTLPPERDFSEDDASDAIDIVVEDLESSEGLDEEADFEDIDPELELGL
jgi:hypothetical protein